MQNQPSNFDPQKQTQPLTFEEYVEIEQYNNQKYEYHNGFIEAMAVGTFSHGTICGNVFGEIYSDLRGKNGTCKAINSEIKLAIETKNNYLYPDCMVVCGEVEKHETKDAITNPKVIIEVLSKSTEGYDRGDKFFWYKKIKSLQQYILIEQDKPQIDIYSRNQVTDENEENTLWKIERIKGLESNLNLTSIDLVISLKSIYKDVFFPILEDEEQEQEQKKEKEDKTE
jgi:Uma2 family endonuclease